MRHIRSTPGAVARLPIGVPPATGERPLVALSGAPESVLPGVAGAVVGAVAMAPSAGRAEHEGPQAAGALAQACGGGRHGDVAAGRDSTPAG